MHISIIFQSLNGAPKHSSIWYNNNSKNYKLKFTQSVTFHPTTKIGTRRSFSYFGVKVKRLVVVKSHKGLNGGGRVNVETTRVLGNLGVAILLTYLSMTGQLGWLLDAVVSIWLIVVLVPIVGIGAFLWWAGRDIVQSSCPNCGNEFQVFKSTLNEELQLCPFCTQPFSVIRDEFVSNPVEVSNQSTTFNQRVREKGRDSSMAVVDVEAEIRDAE